MCPYGSGSIELCWSIPAVRSKGICSTRFRDYERNLLPLDLTVKRFRIRNGVYESAEVDRLLRQFGLQGAAAGPATRFRDYGFFILPLAPSVNMFRIRTGLDVSAGIRLG